MCPSEFGFLPQHGLPIDAKHLGFQEFRFWSSRLRQGKFGDVYAAVERASRDAQHCICSFQLRAFSAENTKNSQTKVPQSFFPSAFEAVQSLKEEVSLQFMEEVSLKKSRLRNLMQFGFCRIHWELTCCKKPKSGRLWQTARRWASNFRGSCEDVQIRICRSIHWCPKVHRAMVYHQSRWSHFVFLDGEMSMQLCAETEPWRQVIHLMRDQIHYNQRAWFWEQEVHVRA